MMPVEMAADDSIRYLQRFLVSNKARGMIAELSLKTELGTSEPQITNKLLSGGWLLSPKVANPQYHRYMASILPVLYTTEAELHTAIATLEHDRGWQALATFLSKSGIGIIVSGATPRSRDVSYTNLQWHNFVYQQEQLLSTDDHYPFITWPGNRGRPSNGAEWQPDVIERFEQSHPNDLTELALRQAFYYGYLKQELKKPIEDPYDVDAFIVSYQGAVIPIEIKEKSPTERGEFGVDAGRILMLLRLCIATDSNAVYVIREVDTSPFRALVGWKYITLADMIIGCRWNLQAGGRGMGGGATQTVMISGDLFQALTQTNFSEEWLDQHRSLQMSVRATATKLAHDLSRYLGRA
jgi:hypothetical protein